MSPHAEVLGHRIVLDGTIGAALYHLREARGQSQATQCHQLRMSQYDFRRLVGRPMPPQATFATDALAIAHACNVGEPRLLLAMLRAAMMLSGLTSATEEAKQSVGE